MTFSVGYLHVGSPEHGVSRYGRLLAAEARGRPELVVRETDLLLDAEPKENRRRLRQAAAELAGSDVVHLQYNCQLASSVWGPGWSQLVNLWSFVRRIRAPLVVSVHDLFPPASWKVICQLTQTKLTLLLRNHLARVHLSTPTGIPSFGLRSKVRYHLRPEAITLRWLTRSGRQLLVCTAEEQERLRHFVPGASVAVIPHFVETRQLSTPPELAKQLLGLTGKRVVTLLGFIHPRKGHVLLVDAIESLPNDVLIVFAGGALPDKQGYLTQLLDRAHAVGVSERIRVTGYLPERELEQYLAATDLAVCPFTAVSASGSLSTWLSVQKPVLASDLPQITEYNTMEPGAIDTFHPYTARALAEGTCRLLNGPPKAMDEAAGRLREKLSISRMLTQHVPAYERLLG